MSFETFRALIAETAGRTGYDAALLAAQAWQESRFNPVAVSPAGARGLMQFMPKTWVWAQEMGWVPKGANITDPALNLLGGVRYMQWLLNRYKGAADPLPLALAAYNAGQGTVDKAISATKRTDWDGVRTHLPGETQGYVPVILGRVAFYRSAFGVAKVAIPGLAVGLLLFLVTVLLRRGLA